MKNILPLFMLLAMGGKPDWASDTSDYPCKTKKKFLWALMMAESGGDTNARYVESNGEISGGLYQLSVGDSYRYSCNFRSELDLYDAKKNTDCALKIIKTLNKKNWGLSWQLTLGKYWAVLRGPEWQNEMRPKSWARFVNYADQVGCVIK